MKLALQDRLRRPLTATGRVAAEVFRDVAPKVLFFFGAFMVLFLIFKLFVAQYSIEYSAFTKAAVAALVLGKVLPLLDWADSGYRFERHRRIVVVLGKTLTYALVVIMLGTGERIVTAFRHEGSVEAAIHFVVENANIHRFLGLVLLLSLVVGPYLTMQELDRAIGKGVLFRVLFQRPANERAGDLRRVQDPVKGTG